MNEREYPDKPFQGREIYDTETNSVRLFDDATYTVNLLKVIMHGSTEATQKFEYNLADYGFHLPALDVDIAVTISSGVMKDRDYAVLITHKVRNPAEGVKEVVLQRKYSLYIGDETYIATVYDFDSSFTTDPEKERDMTQYDYLGLVDELSNVLEFKNNRREHDLRDWMSH